MKEYTMKDVQHGINAAFELFGDKIRKGDGTPVIGHFLRVVGLVQEGGGSCRAQIGAAMHDVLEDIDNGEQFLLDRFGQDIVDLVRECSDTESRPKPPWNARKIAHIEHIRTVSDDALRILLADKIDNGRSLCVLANYANYANLNAFNASPHEQAWYFHMISVVMTEGCVDINGISYQVDELSDIAENLADLVGWTP